MTRYIASALVLVPLATSAQDLIRCSDGLWYFTTCPVGGSSGPGGSWISSDCGSVPCVLDSRDPGGSLPLAPSSPPDRFDTVDCHAGHHVTVMYDGKPLLGIVCSP